MVLWEYKPKSTKWLLRFFSSHDQPPILFSLEKYGGLILFSNGDYHIGDIVRISGSLAIVYQGYIKNKIANSSTVDSYHAEATLCEKQSLLSHTSNLYLMETRILE